MVSLNKVQIIGNVGKAVEMRFTPSGKPNTSFSVACNHSYTDNEGEKHENTEWFNVTTWGRLAETCNQYITKGMQVYAEGRQQTDKWDSEDGQTHYKTKLIANTVLFLGSKSQREEANEPELEDDQIPF